MTYLLTLTFSLEFFIIMFVSQFHVISSEQLWSNLEVNPSDISHDDIDIEYNPPTTSRFGSLHTLQSLSGWASHEDILFKILTERLHLIETETKLIQTYLKQYDGSTGKAIKHFHKPKDTPEERSIIIGWSGVLSHNMITRYTSDIARLKQFFDSSAYRENQVMFRLVLEFSNDFNKKLDKIGKNSNKTEDFVSNILKIHMRSLIWPTWEDKYMSLLTFLHIQDALGYQPRDLMRNFIFDTLNSTGTLNSLQCTEIGVFALYRGYIYMAIQWLELAKNILLEENNEKSIANSFITTMLRLAIQYNYRLVDNISSKTITEKDVADTKFKFLIDNLYINAITEDTPESDRITGWSHLKEKLKTSISSPNHKYDGLFRELCKGKMHQTSLEQSKLKCYYKNTNAYLKINPIKVEQLSQSPPIYQFYEIIGRNEMERIKNESLPSLEMSKVYGGSTNEEMARYRTSVGTWLEHERLEKIIKLAEAVTGLKLQNSSEDTQIAVYTYGRYFIYHLDSLQGEDSAKNGIQEQGDRVATLMYYLDVPKYGGLTPFLNAGISPYPAKGSAILWYNLYRNGTARKDAFHGACPVIYGQKIIMNHWVRYGGNFQNFKCSLNQYE